MGKDEPDRKIIAGIWDISERGCHMDEILKEELSELVSGILKIMDSQLVSIILYGSVARGTATEESDIDVALMVHNKLESDTEDRLSDLIVDLNLKYDKVFSVIDIEYEHFCNWVKVIPFYRNVEQEGIMLWKAA